MLLTENHIRQSADFAACWYLNQLKLSITAVQLKCRVGPQGLSGHHGLVIVHISAANCCCLRDSCKQS